MRYNRAIAAMTAALTAIASLSASAADLGSRPEARQLAPQRSFYVRGDLGVGRYSFGGLSQDDLAANGGTFISESMGDTVIIGAGVGMRLSDRFRLDLTGEYRSTAQIRGMDNVTAQIIDPDGALQANTQYTANLASYVGLLNGYVDLFNWRGFTPYVGVGAGFANHRMSGLTTATSATFTEDATGLQTVQLTQGLASARSQTNFAWALMAGTSYDLSANASLDLGYRYLNLGTGVSTMSGLIDCVCGTVGQPLKLSDLESHEFRIGLRWSLSAGPSDSYHPMK